MKMFDITKYVDINLITIGGDTFITGGKISFCSKTRTIKFNNNNYKCIINNDALIELFHTSPYRTIEIITKSNDSFSYRFDEVFNWSDNVLEVKFNTHIKELFMELTEEEMFYLTMKEGFDDN